MCCDSWGCKELDKDSATELKRKKVLETCPICYVLNTSIEMFFFF